MNEQDKRVREYYEKLSLPKDKLDMLLMTQPTKNADVEDTVHELSVGGRKASAVWLSWFNPSNWQRGNWISAGTLCTIVLAASFWMHNSGSDSERMQRTVREVAMNHSTRLEPEYRGETLDKLDNSMQQLPFALVLPKAIDGEYKLIGSRYCSLAGELAAHVKLKSSGTGKPMSLFVTSNTAALKEIRSQQITLDGIDVEFWRESGLFFALAKRS